MIRDRHLQHPRFGLNVALAYAQKLQNRQQDGGTLDGIHRWMLAKETMHEVAHDMDVSSTTPTSSPPISNSSTAFAVLAAVRRGIVATLAGLRARVPPSWTAEILPDSSDFKQAVDNLKNKAIQLTKHEVFDDI
jgi:hypothetical protein